MLCHYQAPYGSSSPEIFYQWYISVIYVQLAFDSTSSRPRRPDAFKILFLSQHIFVQATIYPTLNMPSSVLARLANSSAARNLIAFGAFSGYVRLPMSIFQCVSYKRSAGPLPNTLMSRQRPKQRLSEDYLKRRQTLVQTYALGLLLQLKCSRINGLQQVLESELASIEMEFVRSSSYRAQDLNKNGIITKSRQIIHGMRLLWMPVSSVGLLTLQVKILSTLAVDRKTRIIGLMNSELFNRYVTILGVHFEKRESEMLEN